MKHTKIASIVISGVFLVGGFTSVAYAGNDSHHDDHDYSMNYSEMGRRDKNFMHHISIDSDHHSDDKNDYKNRWWNNDWMKDDHRDKWNNDYEDRNLSASLNGHEEVPGPGDHDGKGDAQVRVKPHKDEVCVKMWVKDIDQATAAHIHRGGMGAVGPVVVTLPTPNADGYVDGCVSAEKDLLKAVKNNASEYYVNVHNAAYPDGAIRGQLHN